MTNYLRPINKEKTVCFSRNPFGKVFLFSDVYDMQVISEVLQKNNWKKCYFLLNRRDKSFSQEFQQTIKDIILLENMTMFSSIEHLIHFFQENLNEELPEIFIGMHIKQDQRIIELIRRERERLTNINDVIKDTFQIKFPSSFFEKEVREGFEVSELMKRNWSAQLELVKIIDDICEEYGLTYFADGGTLLGAIRHKGYIPWDDDIDLMMFRDDYDKLVKIINETLGEKYSIAGLCQIKKGMKYPNLKNTTFGPKIQNWDYEEYMTRFHGVPFEVRIDIEPLDYVTTDQELLKIQKYLFKRLVYVMQNRDVLMREGKLEQELIQLENLLDAELFRDHRLNGQLFDYAIQILTMSTRKESKKIAFTNYFLSQSNWIFDIDWLKSTIKVPFENIQLPIPNKYHQVLAQEYGEYMIPCQGGALHEYPCYKRAQEEIEERLKQMGYNGTLEEFSRNYKNIWNSLLLKQEIQNYKKCLLNI